MREAGAPQLVLVALEAPLVAWCVLRREHRPAWPINVIDRTPQPTVLVHARPYLASLVSLHFGTLGPRRCKRRRASRDHSDHITHMWLSIASVTVAADVHQRHPSQECSVPGLVPASQY